MTRQAGHASVCSRIGVSLVARSASSAVLSVIEAESGWIRQVVAIGPLDLTANEKDAISPRS